MSTPNEERWTCEQVCSSQSVVLKRIIEIEIKSAPQTRPLFGVEEKRRCPHSQPAIATPRDTPTLDHARP
jgi:hypothetical protein